MFLGQKGMYLPKTCVSTPTPQGPDAFIGQCAPESLVLPCRWTIVCMYVCIRYDTIRLAGVSRSVVFVPVYLVLNHDVHVALMNLHRENSHSSIYA